MTLTFHPAAIADLDDHLDYIVRAAGAAIAESQLSRLHESLKNIQTFPRGARLDPVTNCYEAWVPGTRWIVFYQIAANAVDVRLLAIIDHAQNTDRNKCRLIVPRL